MFTENRTLVKTFFKILKLSLIHILTNQNQNNKNTLNKKCIIKKWNFVCLMVRSSNTSVYRNRNIG